MSDDLESKRMNNENATTIKNKNKYASKIMWGVFFVGSFSIFIFHSSELVMKYLQFETTVTVVLDGIDFILPDIYICNNYPFSKRLIMKHENEKTFHYLGLKNKLFLGKTKYTFPFYINQELEGFSKKFIFDLLSNRSFSDFRQRFTIRNEYINIQDVFEQIPHSYHSYCYKLKKQYERHLFEDGVLEFVLYNDKFTSLNDSLKPPYLSRMMDALTLTDCSHTVYVVPAGEYPHLGSSKKQVESGRKTTISITMSYYDRVSQKEFPCIEQRKMVEYPNYLFNKSGPLRYLQTPLDCAHELMHIDWMNECNCTWEAHPVEYNDWLNDRVRICRAENQVQECTGNYWDKRSVGQYYSQCNHQAACKLIVYSLQSESAPIHMNTQKKYAEQFYLDNVATNPLIEAGYEEWDDTGLPNTRILQSFSTISLFAPKHRSTIWRERFAYELKDLFSDVGGILGFYIGMSVVTFLEIIRHASEYFAGWLTKKKLLERAVISGDVEGGGTTATVPDQAEKSLLNQKEESKI